MLIQSWINLYKFIYILYNNLCIYNFFYIYIKIPNEILASRRNPGKISIYFDFDSTDFRLFRPDPISRPDSNSGGFSRPGFNPNIVLFIFLKRIK